MIINTTNCNCFFILCMFLFQKRTIPPPWWACVGLWPLFQAPNLWLASNQVSAWSISAQRTALLCLPARGRQRYTGKADNSVKKQKQVTAPGWCVLSSDPLPSHSEPFSLSIKSNVCGGGSWLSQTFRYGCRKSCCTASVFSSTVFQSCFMLHLSYITALHSVQIKSRITISHHRTFLSVESNESVSLSVRLCILSVALNRQTGWAAVTF